MSHSSDSRVSIARLKRTMSESSNVTSSTLSSVDKAAAKPKSVHGTLAQHSIHRDDARVRDCYHLDAVCHDSVDASCAIMQHTCQETDSTWLCARQQLAWQVVEGKRSNHGWMRLSHSLTK